MPNWAQVRNDAIAAAAAVLGGSWTAASQGASAQIGLLVQTAQYIDINKGKMTQAECELLVSQQKIALKNVLTAYEAIGLAAAQNAIAAVINTIVAAVPSLLGII